MLGFPGAHVRQPQLTSTKPRHTWPENAASWSVSHPSGQADTQGNDQADFVSPSITGTSQSDCLVSYPGHSLGWGGGSYPSAEVQLVSSTAPGDWARDLISLKKLSSDSVCHTQVFARFSGQVNSIYIDHLFIQINGFK